MFGSCGFVGLEPRFTFISLGVG